MKAIISHFVTDNQGNTLYDGKKPATGVTEVTFPIKFGFGSFNEPKKVFEASGLNADDVLEINIATDIIHGNGKDLNATFIKQYVIDKDVRKVFLAQDRIAICDQDNNILKGIDLFQVFESI